MFGWSPGDNSPMYGSAGWHDFFLMVGGGAAALTGLVFVAMSLHLDQIALHAAHRHRARTVLTGLTAVFIRCALVLMAGQAFGRRCVKPGYPTPHCSGGRSAALPAWSSNR